MNKTKLARFLLEDFKKMFPNSSRNEHAHLFSRLLIMKLKDLQILAREARKIETRSKKD